MRDIWLISDTHFNHSNVLNFTDIHGNLIRGQFKDIKEMNEYICDNWQDTVKDGDIVYHLGDVWFGSAAEGAKIIKKLNGRKRLIVGNHDQIIDVVKTGAFKKIQTWRVFAEFGVILSHIPLHPNNLHLMRYQNVMTNIHGHIHQNPSPDPRYKNVSVEAINYTPINLQELIK